MPGKMSHSVAPYARAGKARLKPGPQPKARYLCVPCRAELGARGIRTHRRSCPCRSQFCANQDGPTKPGPKPKVHYLCMVCVAQLSESDVRTHQRDCCGFLNPKPVSTTEPTSGDLLAQTIALSARLAKLERASDAAGCGPALRAR